jgi:hypothetical protein
MYGLSQVAQSEIGSTLICNLIHVRFAQTETMAHNGRMHLLATLGRDVPSHLRST